MEASTEDELEALKAQAVVSRTFALKNLGRHSSDGYDLCSNTHCQQYSSDESRLRDQMRRAVEETSGESLQESNGQPIDAYFHAACGGATASIESLWGVPAPSYLRGVQDDYCAAAPGREWSDQIPADQLAKALTTDERTNVGRSLTDVVVTRRDPSGRAESITIEGARRKQVRGWEFKMIVGRALGWNVLKSSRFEVSRRGSSFVFRGSGFGHGLGLCQQGAHVMAQRGVAYRQILEHYFPGAIETRAGDGATGGRGEGGTGRVGEGVRGRGERGSYFLRNASFSFSSYQDPHRDPRQLVLKSEHFHITYPANVPRGEIQAVLRTLESAHDDMRHRLDAAGVKFVPGAPVEIVLHATTQDFTTATGQPWFAAGATRGRRIHLQPLAVLRRRRILTSTLRHEYAHAVIEAIGGARTTRWLAEGLAIHFAGEAAMLKRFEGSKRISVDQLERELARPASAAQMRQLYAAASREVLALIQKEGESQVWRRVAAGNRNAVADYSPRLPYSATLGHGVDEYANPTGVALSTKFLPWRSQPLQGYGNSFTPYPR